MGLRLRWGIGAGVLAGMALLSGCHPDGGGETPPAKVLEHTTSQPPPGVVQYQQQQARTAGQVGKTHSDKQ